jgi:hypothetical protein
MGPHVRGEVGGAKVGLIAMWTCVRSLKMSAASLYPGRQVARVGQKSQLTSPVWVNSCSLSLDGLKYALSHPAWMH